MKIALVVLILIALGIGIVEVALRVLFGLGKPPLYVADPQVGYRLAPNQRTKRFNNTFKINQYSMRSPEITRTPETQTLRVLLLGDSIANGGWWTDQSNILSIQIQERLTSQPFGIYTTVEVLNASANSWGPRNELAYLAKFGTFKSRVIVLLLNTDDLFATAPTSAQVGRDPSYPKRYPPLALLEVLSKLQEPRSNPELEAVQQEGGDRVGANLEAVRQIQRIAEQSGCQLVVAMTPLLREVIPPGSRDYETRARQRVARFLEAEGIFYVDFLSAFEGAPDPEALYRDHIHLSVEGNRLVSEKLSNVIKTVLGTLPGPKTSLPDSLLDDPWR